MVYVNSKKFACESCIKGHRSSSCHHTDRPLFEIKKKGRPVSQCEKCRELRQSKRVHSKCNCNEKDDGVKGGEPSRVTPGAKPRRFIPIVPALPNGLQDVLRGSKISGTLRADSRQRVDSLLNPCNCKSVWKCKCQSSQGPNFRMLEGGLDALAHAAALCENEASTSTIPSNGHSARKATKHMSSRPGSPNNSHKRTKHVNKNTAHSPGPSLAPIFSPTPSFPIPNFETMPPMSMITSLAGSGCTCGLQCACPGCLEHRGAEHASKERRNCADGCGTCVDHSDGISLPDHEHAITSSNPVPNFLDKFFARAAALPAPPSNRKMGVGVDLDPMNVMVYPDVARAAGERGLAFGLVSLPKLECCGGRCACPNGICGCGKSCDGCCSTHDGEEARQQSVSSVRESTPAPTPVVRSCCAGKAKAVTVAG